ncbi:MAG: cryptochrome/photolyase family protein, partial [Pseudomonadales bacterium]|nr:cryptochrome/photolyase family protein [Pseudomonadales bacterium]
MPIKKRYKTLRLVLGDQLDIQHSWFAQADASALIVIAEVSSEATYVKHHIQKLCAFFAAMQAFAAELKASGHHVLHLTLDDTAQFDDFPALLVHLCQKYGVERLCYQRADEYRLQQQLSGLKLPQGIAVAESDTE